MDDDLLNPADMSPFQSAKTVVVEISDTFYKNQTPVTAFNCVRALDWWQRKATENMMADVESSAEPHMPYHDAFMDSYKAGMKVVRRLRAQIFFYIVGGKGTWPATWSEEWN